MFKKALSLRLLSILQLPFYVALNFIKGQDITNFKSDKDKEGYKIYTEEKFNFEENAFIAIKYKDMVLGIGQFTAGKIINKISKREKLH